MNQDCSNQKIVVTGVGLVTALGNGRQKTWFNLISGKTGIRKSAEGWEARVEDFSPNGARSRVGDFAILATQDAMHQARIAPHSKVGVAISQSKPIIQNYQLGSSGHNLDTSLLMAPFFGWSVDQVVQQEFQFDGPTINPVAACASGIASISVGVNWIKSGTCEVVMVGASESSLNPFYRTGFDQMGVLSNNFPRPFDKDRNGFVMGEGAAVMVLEIEQSAVERGVEPLAYVENVILKNNSQSSIQFDEEGQAVSDLIRQVMGKNKPPSYINAHGTGTILNDLMEARGIEKVFGADVPVSSTKAATGHLLGASGAVEAAIAVLSLRNQGIPPTLNWAQGDPVCALDFVPGHFRPARLHSALSLSYGFGGQMGAVLFGDVHV